MYCIDIALIYFLKASGAIITKSSVALVSGKKVSFRKRFFRKMNFFFGGGGGGQAKEKFQLFKLDRPAKSMKNKSIIFLKT